jgi:plastocyanin
MISTTLSLLESYYQANTDQMNLMLDGNSATSKLYKSVITKAVNAVKANFSIYNSTLAQLDMDGNVLFSSNEANFATTKAQIKKIKGSVEKIGQSDFLVADTRNNRAVVLRLGETKFTDVFYNRAETVNPIQDSELYENVLMNPKIMQELFDDGGDISVPEETVLWQYNSSRYVTAFRLIPSEISISIYDGSIDSTPTTVRQGDTVTWVNNSSQSIYVYSGFTSYDLFNFNPDLNLYGQDFSSTEIEVGGSWSFTFSGTGTNDWFIYPTILTGKIIVVSPRINSNDYFLIAENDGLSLPFSSRIIKTNYNKNIVWSFGNSYLIKPRNVKPMYNNKVLIST